MRTSYHSRRCTCDGTPRRKQVNVFLSHTHTPGMPIVMLRYSITDRSARAPVRSVTRIMHAVVMAAYICVHERRRKLFEKVRASPRALLGKSVSHRLTGEMITFLLDTLDHLQSKR